MKVEKNNFLTLNKMGIWRLSSLKMYYIWGL